jgi:Tfp pilus assembly protein PilF
MAAKKNPPLPKHQVQAKKQPTPPKQVSIKPGKKNNIHLITAIFIVICGIVLYANTAQHDFVLDDFSVIAENKITQGGMDSVGAIFKSGYREGNYTVEDNLYRPLTKAMFAIEYDIMGGESYFAMPGKTPQLSHWINILLYGLLCGFIFLSLLKFFPQQYYLALITTLLFTFHPIHTEVVANIKSRDEILTLFFLIGSLRCAREYAITEKMKWIVPTAGLYFLALFTKESAITYMALLPVSLYFFSKLSWSKIGIVTVCMLVITGIYLWIHYSVIGGIGLPQESIPIADNSLMATKSGFQRKLTAIYILGLYLKLMVIPHPLSCDYSFDTIPMVKDAGNIGFLLALLVHAGLLAYAVWGFKKKLISSYAIFFYFITLSIVSNVFTLIGTNMAERLVFMPSLGFCLFIGFLVTELLKTDKIFPTAIAEIFSKKAAVWLILLPIMAIFSVKTFSRNKDWKNVSTLFNADIKTVPNSVHMLLYHAGMITNSDSLAIKTPEERLKTLQMAEKDLLKAQEKLEEFPNVHSTLGRVYKEMAEYYLQKQQGTTAADYYNKAILQYQRTLALNAKDPTTYNNYATCYFALGRYDSSEVYFKKAIEISPICYDDALANLGSVYGMYGVAARQQGKPEEATLMFNKSIEMFNKTLECNKDNIQAYQFLGVTYNNLGDSIKARPYLQRYNELLQMKQNKLEKFK